jgi:hypothetical protein
MRYGAVTAFLASNSVHGDLLAHVIARANAIRHLFGMLRLPVRSRTSLFPNECLVSPQSELSNDQVENSAASKTAAEPTRYRIKGTAVALCGM